MYGGTTYGYHRRHYMTQTSSKRFSIQSLWPALITPDLPAPYLSANWQPARPSVAAWPCQHRKHQGIYRHRTGQSPGNLMQVSSLTQANLSRETPTCEERRPGLPDSGSAQPVWRMDALPGMGPHRAGRSGSDGLVRRRGPGRRGPGHAGSVHRVPGPDHASSQKARSAGPEARDHPPSVDHDVDCRTPRVMDELAREKPGISFIMINTSLDKVFPADMNKP